VKTIHVSGDIPTVGGKTEGIPANGSALESSAEHNIRHMYPSATKKVAMMKEPKPAYRPVLHDR
jgi:hypothetical protein